MPNIIHQDYTTLIDYQGGTRPIYIGKCSVPNLSSGAPVWQIKRIVYDTNNNPTLIQYANGTTDFTNVWDSRTILTYS